MSTAGGCDYRVIRDFGRYGMCLLSRRGGNNMGVAGYLNAALYEMRS